MRQYRRTRRTPPAHNLKSTRELREEAKAHDSEVAGIERAMSVVLAEKVRRTHRRVELAELLERIRSQGAGAKFFGLGQHLDVAAKAQIRAIQEALLALDAPMVVNGTTWASVNQAMRDLETRWAAVQAERKRTLSALERVHQAEEKDRRKQEREALSKQRKLIRAERAALDAALAARVKGTIRGDAARVGKRLRRDHDCPYCGGPLGQTPHKDHIHPVSKGGLSIEKNLVYVCQACNIFKRGDTLNQFIDRAKLNYTVIRNRLGLLGKDC